MGLRQIGVALVLGAVVACGSEAGTSGGGAGGGPLPSVNTGGGSGGSDDGSGVGATPVVDPTDPAVPDAKKPPVVDALGITEVAVFQAVKVPVMKAGKAVPAASRNAPLVAGRDALVRVYVKAFEDWQAHPTVAELRLENGPEKLPLLLDTKTITKDSLDEELASTFDFEVPGANITSETRFSVTIREATGTATPGAAGGGRYPQDGLADLSANASAKLVRIKLVPVKYDADGSGRVPDVSAAAIERYRAAAYAQYPTAQVEVTVREPFAWSRTIGGNGSGWSSILNALVNLRAEDGAPKDVYYYGAFVPKAQFSDFCRGGCVLGLSGLVDDPRDDSQRASIGVGYKGQESTMVHEIGHAMGRPHAPCGGADGVDPDFPYEGGSIGVWGYDLVTKKLWSPARAKDFMGYCDPSFVSDYTYRQLFERISWVNTNPQMVASAGARTTYRYLDVGANGEATWGDAVTLEHPLHSSPHAMRFASVDGRTLDVTGHFYPFHDLPGGYFLVPEPPRGFSDLHILDRPRGVTLPQTLRLAR